jgi:hypothetical protein
VKGRLLAIGLFQVLWFCSASLSAQEGPAKAQDAAQDTPRVIVVQGAISRNLLRSLRGVLREEASDIFPAGLIVLLDSPGGDGFAAMELGELLRRAKAHVFVTGQCASACVLVLASGVVRGAGAYTVGLHRGRVTVSYADGKVKQELQPQNDPEAARVFREFETAARQYLSRMGMSPLVFETMQKFERRSVYRLNNQEMRDYGVVGIEPQYLMERTQQFPLLTQSHGITPTELTDRVQRVPIRCGGLSADKIAFVECYRNALISPK